MQKEDDRLREEIDRIRGLEDAKDITVRESADLRIAATEKHLAACREHRRYPEN